jgi:hypothetical protein
MKKLAIVVSCAVVLTFIGCGQTPQPPTATPSSSAQAGTEGNPVTLCSDTLQIQQDDIFQPGGGVTTDKPVKPPAPPNTGGANNGCN